MASESDAIRNDSGVRWYGKTVSSMDVGVVVLEEAATKDSSMDSDDSAVATLYRLAKFVQYSVATYLKMAQ